MLRCDLFNIGTLPSGSNIYSTVYILILYNCHTTNCTSSQVPFGYLIRRDNIYFYKVKKIIERENKCHPTHREREREIETERQLRESEPGYGAYYYGTHRQTDGDNTKYTKF